MVNLPSSAHIEEAGDLELAKHCRLVLWGILWYLAVYASRTQSRPRTQIFIKKKQLKYLLYK